MLKTLLLSFLFLTLNQAMAAGLIVKNVRASGFSGADLDGTTSDVKVIYGGIAGACLTTDGSSTCNSCSNTTSLFACNTMSVYPGLPLVISYKLKEAASGATVQYFLTDAGGAVTTNTLPSVTGPAESSFSFQITWNDLCGTTLPNCSSSATSSQLMVKTLSFGVDSNANNSVDNDERISITIKLHVIPTTVASTTIAQTQCLSGASASAGLCFMEFAAGDEKIFVKSNPQPQISSADATVTGGSIDWDGFAVFPIPVDSASEDTTAITNFKTGQVSPITRALNAVDGSIPDSQISGGIQNFQRYCFIYGTKNKAQNIYKFVAGAQASADATVIARSICLVPSENVGILDDKSCFISTAAFGSNFADEVKTFRHFRNQYLMKTTLGKLFVHYYYKFSPPLADFISQSEFLRALARGVLYPFFAFSYIALNYGFAAALLTLIVLFILILSIRKVVKQKTLLLFLMLLIFAPLLKAQTESGEKVIQHQDAQNGLVKIKKDGTYIYDSDRPFKKDSSRITFGQAQQPEISIAIEKTSAKGAGTGEFKTFNFQDFYGEASHLIIGYDYEWFPWVNQGKFGVQGGVSMMFAQGHGIQTASLESSAENYTFVTLPLTLGPVYRFEYKDKQLVAPYVSGGGTYTVLIEKREDKSKPNVTASPGFYAAGGALLNLSVIDSESGFALDSEYGISNLWISVEYRIIEVDSDNFKFSNRYVNAGLTFDF